MLFLNEEYNEVKNMQYITTWLKKSVTSPIVSLPE